MQSAIGRVRAHRESYSAISKANAAALIMHGVTSPDGDLPTEDLGDLQVWTIFIFFFPFLSCSRLCVLTPLNSSRLRC